jgi:hypothetical protein
MSALIQALAHTHKIKTHTHLHSQVRASENSWADKLTRFKEASDLHVQGLQHELEQMRLRAAKYEAENQTLSETATRAQLLAHSLQQRYGFMTI